MACSLPLRLICTNSDSLTVKSNLSSSKSRTVRRNLSSSAPIFLRLRNLHVRKSCPSEEATSTTTSLETPSPEHKRAPDSSPFTSFLVQLRRLRNGWKFDSIGKEMFEIALPAALALAADPITSLIDTAYVGHLGSAELAAVGVSASVFNLVSKLFNVPLLNITTSFVAEEQALSSGGDDVAQMDGDRMSDVRNKKPLPSVSTSLALATAIGVAEAFALSVGSGILMNVMGVSVDSPMRMPAEQFLTLRALGAPAIVIALAAQGTFRGFMDTKTPLYAIVSGNVLNGVLSPVMIYLFGLGIGGVAVSTVISEYLIALLLLWKLSDKVLLVPSTFNSRKIASYLKSGGLLISRTFAVLITMTLATSMAAREGPIPMAGYQICVQIWLAVSLLTDALAIAGQAILASSYSKGDYKQARIVTYRALQISIGTGITLAIALFFGFGPLSGLFSTDSKVLEIARSGILFVAGSQPVNALAFVLDGLYYGVSDFVYAAYSMVLVGLLSSVFLLLATPALGLSGVWAGLFLFMSLRVVAGVLRLGTKSGPWNLIWHKLERKQIE